MALALINTAKKTVTMSSNIERRRHERVEVTKAIYLEVVPRGVGKRGPNPVIRCETLDVSIRGLRLLVPEAVKIGSRLNVAVPAEDWIENLELTGEVRWLQEADQCAGYWLGLELQDTNRENMERWFKTVQTLRQQNS